MIDFMHLSTLNGLLNGKLLAKYVILIGDFRFDNLNRVFAVILAFNFLVKLGDLKDPLDKGIHTTDTSPSLHPGGAIQFLKSKPQIPKRNNYRDTKNRKTQIHNL